MPAMTSSILNVTFDCSDGERLARFWSTVTGWPWSKTDMHDNPFWVVADPDAPGVRLVFVEVSEVKTVKNRVHLDLLPADESRPTELARIISHGATIIDDRRERSPGGWIVLADPEGNEFCLE
jgi:predicted enzyme related to lactoylglutathione lyase